jgi:exonuclease III
MLHIGKMHTLEQEMAQVRLDMCGLAEVTQEGQGHFNTIEGYTVVYSGGEKQGQNGVAIWSHKRVPLMGYEPVNERIVVVRINGKPKNITMVQMYDPTATADEEIVQVFLDDLNRTLNAVPKHDFVIVMGDFNAKVGSQRTGSSVGCFGLGELNDAGDRFRKFCEDKHLSLVNIWFKKHPRRLYTRTSPDGQTRNQIDYIAVGQQWRKCVVDCTTHPGANCDSDHKLLVAILRLKLRRLDKGIEVRKLNLEEPQGDKAQQYSVEVKNRFDVLTHVQEETTPGEL